MGCWPRWPWNLHREWAKRAEDAHAEVQKSQDDLEKARREVMTPAREIRDRNHFAEIIRASLIEGRSAR